MSEGLYSHTTRGTGTVLTAAIYNSDHQNHITNQNPSMTGGYSDNVAEMQLVTDPGGLGSEDLAASLAGELERIRFAIERITGEAQWYIAPDINLVDTALAVVAGTFEKLFITNELTPAQITADQNNYAPTGHADAFHFRLSSDALRNITGLAGGALGRIVCLTNIGSFDIALVDESGSSTEANRFALGVWAPIVLNTDESITLRYDATSDRWRPLHSAVPDADDIPYSNASSGLTATNLQAALDELEARVDDLEEFAIEHIASGTISGTPTEVDIALGSYDMVEVDLMGIRPTTDASSIFLRFSQDGGSNYLAGASDYAWELENSGAATADQADNEITVTGGIGNAAGRYGNVTLRVFRPAVASFGKAVTWLGGYIDNAGVTRANQGVGRLVLNENAVTHLRVFLEGGSTFAAGHYAARGYKFN